MKRPPTKSQPAAPMTAIPDQPFRFILDNGLHVIVQPDHSARVVAIQAWVSVGAADEPPNLAGIAHVFEHMLFKGTARRTVGQVAAEIEGAGGDINAWTSLDETVYHLVLASRFFETGLDVLADVLANSSFDPTELERERKVVLEEIRLGEDQPGRVLTQALFATAFREHPYRRPVIGTERSVKALTRDVLIDFYRRHYVAGNITLVVVGDIDPGTAKKKIAAVFGQIPKGGGLHLTRAREPEQRAMRVTVVERDVKEAQLALAFHVPDVRHRDTAALDVAAAVLGAGESARLHTSLRRERQLVSDAWATAYTPRDPGLFWIGAALRSDQLQPALKAVSEELFRLCYEDISADELDRVRRQLLADSVYQQETMEGQARKLGFFQTMAGGLEREAEYRRQLNELTTGTLRTAVCQYLDPRTATVGVMAEKGRAPSESRIRAAVEEGARMAAERYDTPPTTAKAPAPGGQVVRARLPSGVRLLVQRAPSVGLVAMRAAWSGGLRWEDERIGGIHQLIARALPRGTASRPGDAILREIEGRAGSIAGVAGRNTLGLRLELLSGDWERGLELLADCAQHPAFAEQELERERREMLEELRAQEDHPGGEALRLFLRTLYPHHPYRLDELGTPQSVAGLSRKKVVDFFRRHYPIDRLVVSIVGDVDPDEVVKKARALFSEPRAKSEPPAGPAIDGPPTGPQQVWKFVAKQQAHVIYGFPGLTLSDPDRYALEVLTTVLAGQSGRLFTELRDKRGLAYRVSAYSVEGIDPGYLAIYLAVSPANLDVAVSMVRDELAQLVAKPLPRAEIDRAERALVGGHEIALQRRGALASALALDEANGLGWQEHQRYAERILAVTVADVHRVAQRILDPRRAMIATVKPEERTRVLAKPVAAEPKAGKPGKPIHSANKRRGR